jgi:uncharacterized protein YjbI with pentapeptide repeats
MNDKKRSLRMRNFNDELIKNRFAAIKISFNIPPLNFSKKTITAADVNNIKSSFKNAIFTGSTLNDITFKDIDLTGANFLKATLNSVTFDNCNLTKATFSSGKLNENTRFINKCILSNSFFVDSELYGVNFESCTLTGVDFSGANLYTKIIEPSGDNEDSQYIYTKFVNIDQFNNALFKKAKLYGVSFENCNLTKADFSEADLKFILDEEQDGEEGEGYLFTFFVDVNLEEANFTSAFLNSVSFVAVNLKKTDFTKAYLLKLNNLLDVYLEDTLFVSATIKELDFSYANYYPENPENINKDGIFLGLDFSNADLEDVKFRSKRYVEVNFSKAQLTNVNLSFSDLTGSNFSEATLTNVNLSNTNFTDADLSEAQFIYAIQDYVNSNIKFNGANLNNAYFKNCSFERFSFDDATDFGDTITSFFDCVIYIDNSNPIDEDGNDPYGYFIDNVYVDNCEIYIIS